MKTKKPKERKENLKEVFIWVIKIFGVFLTICWFFFYSWPITAPDGNILYRLGWFAENLVILLVLYKIATFKSNENENKKT